MRQKALAWKKEGKTISFVPTMGFIHEGHLSLIRIARSKGDILVVSIFVNPTQFGPSEDFDSYPRDLDHDLALCEKEEVDIVFVPISSDIYPAGYSTYIEEMELSRELCGASRPGHFRGVTTIVAKLFNIIQPDIAIFGRKDYQQSRVIMKMVKDLNIPIRIETGPIVREEDGLAMSSRNNNLDREQRKSALCLRRALLQAEEMIRTGERDVKIVRSKIKEIIEREPFARIDYIEIRDSETLQPRDRIGEGTLIALAVFIGSTRLIDNLVMGSNL